MIAHWGIPGSSQFHFARVPDRASGLDWIAGQLAAKGETTEEDRVNHRQSGVLTEKEARACRYRSGRPIYRLEVGVIDDDQAVAS